jgi:spore germination cell wall hydrolase CwlJ-like protein
VNKFLRAVLCLLAVMIMGCDREPVWAQVNYPSNLWQGLVAEATSEGYQGMYAVACVVRNRLEIGMNTGLCGLKRKNLNAFCKREGIKREKEAKEIVNLVFEQGSKDITNGAIHFECIEKYGMPLWAKTMIITCKVGEHTFFKPNQSKSGKRR